MSSVHFDNDQPTGWREAREAMLHGGAGGGTAAGPESGRRSNLGQSDTGREASRLADLIAACIIVIFPASHYTGTLHQETHPISPMTLHTHPHTHACLHTHGKGNTVTTALN